MFPCWPRKKEPAIRDNIRLAAVEPVVIRRFWGEQGSYNIGVATGRASGIWVTDVDADKGGEATLRELEAKHGALPCGRVSCQCVVRHVSQEPHQ